MLSAAEQAVCDELRAILKGPDADALYNSVDGAMSGKILNADLARELSPHYRTVSDRIAFTKATYEPARDYVYERFLRTVRAPSRQVKIAMLLAGGAGSGKSTSIRRVLEAADLVFDSNCANCDRACTLIDGAIKAKWGVFVVYIHRNFQAAVEGMLSRAIECGRYIPLIGENGQCMPELHFHSQHTFLQLLERYADDNSVRFAAMRNPWTPENPAAPSGIQFATLAPGGKRHYTGTEKLYEIQADVANRFLVERGLSTELCRALGIA